MVSRRSWWRRTFQRFWKSPRRPYRRRPDHTVELLIQTLEDRTLLSAVAFTGRNLTWNGFGATMGANAAQMSVDGTGMLILHDTSGESISLAARPGWSGNGTSTVMGPLSGVSGVDDITIDGTAPANPADTFTLMNGGGAVNLTGAFTVTGFQMIAVNTSLTVNAASNAAVSLTANAATGPSTLGFGTGVTVAADIQSYRAGNVADTTSAADLVTNTPQFTASNGSSTPGMFAYEQDADITAANFPNPATQFGGGTLPGIYSLKSDDGSIATPATTVSSPGTDLTLNANMALTINNSWTLHTLSASAGGSGVGDLSFGAASITINADTQQYMAGNGQLATARADLVTNAPTFRNTASTAPPVSMTFTQDASIAATDIPNPSQFGGVLPGTYSITSTGGDLTYPATSANSPTTSLTLSAELGLTINGAATLTLLALTAMAGTSGTGNLTFGPGVTINANSQDYEAGSGTGTTAVADLVTNAPSFRNTAGTAAPVMFTDRQDASVTASVVADSGRFGGALPTTYLIQSIQGSITTPATTVVSSSTGLTLDALNGVTIAWALTLTGLTVTAGGDISLTAAISASGTVTLTTTGGMIGESGGGAITANQLDTSSVTGTTLTGTNAVTNLQASNSGSNDVMFHNTASLTVNGTGISETGGNVTLMVTGSLTVTGPIDDGGNTVSLMASGAISGAGVITANQLDTSSATGTSLTGTNGVANFQATNSTSGAIVFDDAAALLTLGVISQTGGGDVTITNTGGDLDVNGKITMSGGNLQLTSDGVVNINAAIDPPATILISAFGDANINNPVTATSLIQVMAGQGPTNTGNVNVNAGGSLTETTSGGTGIELFTGTAAGSITLMGPLNAQDSVALVATNNVTETGAGDTITAAGLLLIGGTGTFALAQANAVGTLAGSFTGTLNFNDTIALTVGTVFVTSGLNSNGNAITLTVNAGASLLTIGTAANGQSITASGAIVDIQAGGVTENTNAIITAASLRLQGTGTFNLAQANAVGTLAGNVTGALTFNDTIALTVGTVLATSGLNSNGNAITLTVNGGASLLTIGTAANGQSITATGAIVDIQAGGVTENTNAIITASSLRLQGTGTFTLAQGNLVGTLAGNFTGALTFNDTIALTVGTVLGTAGLNSNASNITLTVNNGTSLLTIGTASNGQSITATGATVDLFAGGVTENTNAIITATNLRLRGTGTFALAQANAVAILTGNFTGTLNFTNTTVLTVSNVLGTLGLNSNGNNIVMTLNGGLGLLTINTPAGPGIVATGATVDLFVGGVNEASAGSIITANALRLRGTGIFNLNPTNPNVVATLAGSFTGALTFRDNSPNPAGLTVGTVLGTVGLTSANNNITLCNSGDIFINQPINAGMSAGTVTVRLKSGGSVTQGTGGGAMGVITADNLGVDAVGGVILDKFSNNVSVFAARGSAVSVRFAGLFSLGTVAPANASDCFTSTITGIMAPSGPQDITICQDTGTLTINMPLNAGTGTVRLVASNGGVTQTAGGAITAAALGVHATSDASVVAGGDIALDLANNNVGTFAALNTDANRWAIRFLNTNPAGTLVGTVTAASPCFIQTAGVVNTNGDVTLNSNNGAAGLTIGTSPAGGEGITATGGTVDLFAGGVTETAGSIVTATNLRLRGAGPGPVTFGLGQTNAISGNLAGDFFGPLSFTNNAAITIASITLNAVTTPDLNSHGNNVTLTLNNGMGLLTINTSTGMGIQAGAATVDLNVGGVTEATSTSIITAGGLRLQGTGTFNLNQPNVVATIAGRVTGALTLIDTVALTVGTVLGMPGLGASGDVTLVVGSGTLPLAINVPGLNGLGGATVDINAGGVSEIAAYGIFATSLRLRSAPGGPFPFNLQSAANSTGTIAGDFYGPLTYVSISGQTLVVGTVLGTPGLNSHGSNITLALQSHPNLTIGTASNGESITATGATVDILAGVVTESPNAIISAASLRLQGTGGFILTQNNHVNVIAGSFTGDLNFLNSMPLIVGTVLTTAGLTSSTGSITLNAANGTALLVIGTPPTAGSGEGIFAAQGTVELFSGGAVEVSGATIMAARLLIINAPGGPFTFNLNQTNTVGTIAGRVNGDVGFTNSGALTVGTILGVAGLGASGTIGLVLATGTAPLTIGTPPTAGSGEGIFAGATVILFAGGATESTGAAITAARLLLLTGPGGAFAFSLTQTGNSVGTIAGRSTGDISYTNASPLVMGTIFGTIGIITPGNVTLVVGGGTLPLTLDTQPSTGSGGILGGSIVDIDAGGVNEISAGIEANSLRLRSAPGGPFPFLLTDRFVNLVSTIAGDFYGPLAYTSNFIAPLTVDTVLGTAGLTSHGSAITLTLVWQLTVNQTINAGTTGNLNITATNAVTFNNDAQVTANAALIQKGPNSFGPNTLVVNYSGLVDTTWTITGADAGTIANSRFTITSSPQAIAFTGFQTLIGGAGADAFIFNDGATLGGRIDGGQATVAGKIDTIDWSRYTTARMVRVLGPAVHGVFGSEPSVAGGFTDIDRLVGPNSGSSTLIGPDHNNTWSITGMNSGTLTTDYGGGVMSQVAFAGFPNLKGGALIDNFVFQNGGQVTGTVDGGGVPAGLADTLDWSAVTTNRVVGIAGFGAMHGYAGSEAQSVNAFTNIDQVIGSATTMQNSLFGENQDRTWIVGVNAMGTNVQGVYGPASLAPALFFANFQTLVGGSGADTFFVNATPAGKPVTLFGGGGTNTFNVGGTVNSLDQIVGPLGIVGGGSPTTTPQSVSATVSCPPAPGQAANAHPAVTQTVNWVSGGNTVNITDVAGASGASGLTYGLGRGGFSRTATGTIPVFVSYLSVETVNVLTSPNPTQAVNIADTAVVDAANPGTLIHAQTTVQVSGTGSNTVNVFNTGDSSALFLNASAGNTAVGIFRTGVNSYTKVTVGGSIFQAGSGMASIVDITGSGDQVNFLGQTPGTGPNSVTRVTMAGTINLQSADPTSGLSLMGGQVNVGLFGNATPSYRPHPFATAVVTVAGPGVLNFVNTANQPSAINTDEFRFVSGGATGNNLITSPDETAVYLCSGPGVTLPQATFVATTFLLPNQLDASGRPVATIVLVSQLARSFPIQNFSLPPVVASPNFASPFGFGPPSVTVADINGDGVPDLIVGSGQGYAPLVTVFDGRTVFNTLGAAPTVLAQFFAYDSRFVGGVYVAAGHIDAGLAPMANAIITGTGRGVFPVVEAFVLGGPSNPNAFPVGGVIMIRFFQPYPNTLGGVRVASGRFDNSGLDDIVTAPGPGDAPNVRVFSGTSSGNSVQPLRSFFAYDPAFVGGVDVAVGHLLGDAFDDIVTAPASAGTTQVNVFNGHTGVLQSLFSAFPGTFNGVGGIAVDASAGTPRIIVGSALGQPAQVKAFDVLGDPLALTPTPFFDAAGNPTNNPALANHQGVAVGGRSR